MATKKDIEATESKVKKIPKTKAKTSTKPKNKTTKRDMTEQEKLEFDELYQYVRGTIMNYPKTRMLPPYFVMRLKGLNEGKFYSNKANKSLGHYDYKVILYAFEICKYKIHDAWNKKTFQDESHKINYCMVIIESNINDIAIRLDNAERSRQNIQDLSLDNVTHEGALYKPKTKEISDSLKELM